MLANLTLADKRDKPDEKSNNTQMDQIDKMNKNKLKNEESFRPSQRQLRQRTKQTEINSSAAWLAH